MKTGKIVIGIDKKVYFEPDGLPKPIARHFCLTPKLYIKKLKEYEASKRSVKVSNVDKWEITGTWVVNNNLNLECKNNQPCKAEITGDKATITELIKEKDSYKKTT